MKASRREKSAETTPVFMSQIILILDIGFCCEIESRNHFRLLSAYAFFSSGFCLFFFCAGTLCLQKGYKE